MFRTGELVLYGGTGVCRVEDIVQKELPDGTRDYYVLQPLYQDCVISTPVNSTKVFIRSVITREQAEELIDKIPSVKAKAYHNRVLRQLAEHYEQSLKSHDCEDLVKLTMSIYAKKQDMIRQNRKFGAVDERFMKRAEELLFGELGAALGIDKDEVPDYIAARVGDIKGAASGE